MIKKAISKMNFDDALQVLRVAKRIATAAPEKAAEFMKNNGCDHLIEKVDFLPEDVKAKCADKAVEAAKTIEKLNLAKAAKFAEKVPGKFGTKTIIGVTLVTAAVAGYFWYNSKNQDDNNHRDNG